MVYLKQSQKRTEAVSEEIRESVSRIIQHVLNEGDSALLHYNKEFDHCHRQQLRVSREEIAAAYQTVGEEAVKDLTAAAGNIRAFAGAQRSTLHDLEQFSPAPGVMLGHRTIPMQSCCCYVPGGSYPLYSSALMLAIPAKVAGVGRVVACSPMGKGTDQIHPMTLVALDIAGVDEIYAVGGAHAIAAFSYGTGQIKPVDLIVGPGNAYVTEAKRQCFGQVGIDFLAGPSEVLVLADYTADPEVIAIDLLAQSEHDRLAKGIVVTSDRNTGEQIIAHVERMLQTLETAEIAKQSWADFGEVILVDSVDEAIAISNDYAPEHLEVQWEGAESWTDRLVNYGSLFLGRYTAEVFGDYASGTNHTLPTVKAARYTGGVWVGTFLKTCTHQSFSLEAMQQLAPLVSRLARGEGLIAHARAAELRAEKWG